MVVLVTLKLIPVQIVLLSFWLKILLVVRYLFPQLLYQLDN